MRRPGWPGGRSRRTGRPGLAGLVGESYFTQRIDDYLAFATTSPGSSNTVGVAAHLIRAAREPGYTWDIASVGVGSFPDSWARIDNWEDTRETSTSCTCTGCSPWVRARPR